MARTAWAVCSGHSETGQNSDQRPKRQIRGRSWRWRPDLASLQSTHDSGSGIHEPAPTWRRLKAARPARWPGEAIGWLSASLAEPISSRSTDDLGSSAEASRALMHLKSRLGLQCHHHRWETQSILSAALLVSMYCRIWDAEHANQQCCLRRMSCRAARTNVTAPASV